MRKIDEVNNSKSCFNKSREEEMLFVLLGRDPAAPVAIRQWAKCRLAMGLNRIDDPQITEALEAADAMDIERIAAGGK